MSEFAGAARPTDTAIEMKMRPRAMQIPAKKAIVNSFAPRSKSSRCINGIKRKRQMPYSNIVASTPRSAPLYVFLYILMNKCFVDMSIAPIIPQMMPTNPAVSFSRPKASSGSYSSLFSPPFYAAAMLMQMTHAIENAMPMKCNGLIFSPNFKYMMTMLKILAKEIIEAMTP